MLPKSSASSPVAVSAAGRATAAAHSLVVVSICLPSCFVITTSTPEKKSFYLCDILQIFIGRGYVEPAALPGRCPGLAPEEPVQPDSEGSCRLM